MVTFTLHPPPRLHHLPPHRDSTMTGEGDQKPALQTEEPPWPNRITQQLEVGPVESRTLLSPLGSNGVHSLTTWPVLTPPASLMFPVSPPTPGLLGADAARMVTLGMESHVKVKCVKVKSEKLLKWSSSTSYVPKSLLPSSMNYWVRSLIQGSKGNLLLLWQLCAGISVGWTWSALCPTPAPARTDSLDTIVI